MFTKEAQLHNIDILSLFYPYFTASSYAYSDISFFNSIDPSELDRPFSPSFKPSGTLEETSWCFPGTNDRKIDASVCLPSMTGNTVTEKIAKNWNSIQHITNSRNACNLPPKGERQSPSHGRRSWKRCIHLRTCYAMQLLDMCVFYCKKRLT